MMKISRFLAVLTSLCLAGTASAQESKGTITYRTADGYFLASTLGIPADAGSVVPGVVLVHGADQTRAVWDGLFDRLLGAGYLVLSYDIRGHGKSTPLPEDYTRDRLTSDPAMAPLDLATALNVVAGLDMVDGKRVGIVGASFGADLAIAAATRGNVKTVVALSPDAAAVRALARRDSLSLSSVYYIAGSKAAGGKQAASARALYDGTGEPRQIEIIEDTAAEGTGILRAKHGTADRILVWLAETL